MRKKKTESKFVSKKIPKLLDFDHRYTESINEVYKQAKAIWSLDRIVRFTDHSIRHSERVLEYALEISKKLINPLNNEEKLWLSMACLLHDIGMQYGHFSKKHANTGEPIDNWISVRRKHVDLSVLMVKSMLGDQEASKQLKGGTQSLASISSFLQSNGVHIPGAFVKLTAIIKAHTKDTNGRESGWYDLLRHNGYNTLRLTYLGALLRFADEIDISHKRILDYGIFERGEIPFDSIEYWLTACFFREVEIENRNSAIAVRFKIDYHSIPHDKELSDFCHFLINRQIKKIIRTLTKPITPGDKCIADIFLENGIAVRIEPTGVDKTGNLGKADSLNNKSIYDHIKIAYKNLSCNGFSSDTIGLEFFSFDECEDTKVLFVKEMNGFTLPTNFRKRIVEWIKKNKFKLPNTNYHSAFNRIYQGQNLIEEYLPDGGTAPISILGVAAATCSLRNNIKNLQILPCKICCSTELKNDSVLVHFPEFSRPPFSFPKNEDHYLAPGGVWDLIKIFYTPPGEGDEEFNRGMKSIVYALITSMGEITFAIIPSDQNIIPNDQDLEDDLMPGAGVLSFFNDSDEQANNNSKGYWKRTRESLLKVISRSIKQQAGLKGTLVSSIIGYIEEERKYKVISWREGKEKITNHVHIGMIAAALPFLQKESTESLKEPPLNIKGEVFPRTYDESINVELWGGKGNNTFKVMPHHNSLSIEINVRKDFEIKMEKI